MTKRHLFILAFSGILLLALSFAAVPPSQADDCDLIYEGECFELEQTYIYILSYIVKRHNLDTGCLEFWDVWVKSSRRNPFPIQSLRTADPNLVQYRNQHNNFVAGEVWDWDFDAAEQNGVVTVFSQRKIYERCNPILRYPEDDKPERDGPVWDPIPPHKINKLETLDVGNPVYVHLVEMEGIESNGVLPDGMGARFLLADEGDAKAILAQLGIK